MAQPKRGEVWLVDLGLAAKIRPCLLLTDSPADDELAWEHACQKSFLKPGAFHLQQVQSVSIAKLVRRLGALDSAEMARVAERLRSRLGLL